MIDQSRSIRTKSWGDFASGFFLLRLVLQVKKLSTQSPAFLRVPRWRHRNPDRALRVEPVWTAEPERSAMGSRWKFIGIMGVMIMTEAEIRERAEQYIAESRFEDLHTCDAPESECVGCDLMRKGLQMLRDLDDPTVHEG